MWLGLAPHLVSVGPLVLDYAPRQAVITVSHLESGHELNTPEVLGPLGNDARDALGRFQINLPSYETADVRGAH